MKGTHFTSEDTGEHKGSVACPKSHNTYRARKDLTQTPTGLQNPGYHHAILSPWSIGEFTGTLLEGRVSMVWKCNEWGQVEHLNSHREGGKLAASGLKATTTHL